MSLQYYCHCHAASGYIHVPLNITSCLVFYSQQYPKHENIYLKKIPNVAYAAAKGD